MDAAKKAESNVKQVVPFLRVADMDRSIRFYMNGIGFSMKHKWVAGEELRWCWLELGGAALMLQTYIQKGPHAWTPLGKLGEGVSLSFQRQDALAIYGEMLGSGIAASEPQVGNAMWVTYLYDPDGYRIEFESRTETPEETKLSELNS